MEVEYIDGRLECVGEGYSLKFSQFLLNNIRLLILFSFNNI